MKRLFSIFAVLSLLSAAGCSDNAKVGDGDDNKDDNKQPVAGIVFDGDEIPAPVMKADGSFVSVGFTASESWTVETDMEWLTITPASGAAGHAQIVIKGQANEDLEERNAAVTLRAGEYTERFTVTQKQKDALTVTSDKVELNEDGGQFDVEFSSNVDAAVEYEIAASARDWITGATASRAVTNGTLTFSVAENMNEAARQGTITLKAGEQTATVTVYQLGREPRLIISQRYVTAPADGGVVKVEAQSNVGDVIFEQPAESWIRQTGTRSMSSYTFNFEVDPNNGNDVRTAKIYFTANEGKLRETVEFTQFPKNADGKLFKWPGNEETDGITRAFPGAEGGGMYTTGGRSTEERQTTIYHVTNLNDSGVGSLRYGLDMNDPRIIVFDVAGDIILKSDIGINKGNVTVAGQTAPGDGICVRGGTVNIKCSNVVIRYMRFRLGDESKFLSDGSDCIWGRYNENIILDHCSMSWSVDEVASFYANKNFTMQWCMVAESMCNSVHGKGGHGYGGIWGGRNASFHHNMLAHNKSRNARIDHPEIYGGPSSNGTFTYIPSHRGNVDLRNNVIYNWGDNNTYGGEGGWFNFVGNYYKPGPASKDRKYFIDADGYYSSGKRQYDYPRLYLEGNKHTKYPQFDNDQQAGVYLHDGDQTGNPGTMYLKQPLSIMKDDTEVCYTTTHSADDAFNIVLNHVGVSHRRDAVDAHIVYDARYGVATYALGSNGSSGGIIDSQKDVGGWPVLTATEEELARVIDTDGDGIPDYYEGLFGLDMNDATDAAGHNFDARYTNLEMYLHYLVQDTVAAQVAGGQNTEMK